MPKPCSKSNCSGLADLEGGECEGSDDEFFQHCSDCGNLSARHKGCNCGKCDKYWCDDYQHMFIFDSSCDGISTGFDEGVCIHCVVKYKKYQCKSPCVDAKCPAKKENALKAIADHEERGILCASVDMKKDEDNLSFNVYRYPKDEKKFRTTSVKVAKMVAEPTVEKIYSKWPEEHIAEIQAALDDGWKPIRGKYMDKNYWGFYNEFFTS